MKKKAITLCLALLILCGYHASGDKDAEMVSSPSDIVQINNSDDNSVDYASFDVPQVDSSFKSWMDYRAVTNENSDQYKYINTYGWRDVNGFMRSGADWNYGITEDYYLVALGSYYGTTIGTKYKITTDTGNVFYGVLADCKANIHTDSTNRYNPWNGNVVEFIVDSNVLNPDVKISGSANVLPQFNGRIKSIEKIEFLKG